MLNKGISNTLTTPPSNMVTRHGTTIAIVALFWPLHHRKKTNATLLQPIINIAAVVLYIGFCPTLSPFFSWANLAAVWPLPQKPFVGIVNFFSFFSWVVCWYLSTKGLLVLPTKHFLPVTC